MSDLFLRDAKDIVKCVDLRDREYWRESSFATYAKFWRWIKNCDTLVLTAFNIAIVVVVSEHSG